MRHSRVHRSRNPQDKRRQLSPFGGGERYVQFGSRLLQAALRQVPILRQSLRLSAQEQLRMPHRAGRDPKRRLWRDIVIENDAINQATPSNHPGRSTEMSLFAGEAEADEETTSGVGQCAPSQQLDLH